MKIAVTYENGEIFQHFGHTEQFKIYKIEDGKAISSEVVSTMGSGHGALAGFLKEQGVDTLICGGIGGGAKMALEEAGITLYGGVCGNADKSIEELLENKLNYNAEVECSQHHDEEHSCGEHSCSSH
jgi:predicted Fe-Mo cluster-binding NifX family protein